MSAAVYVEYVLLIVVLLLAANKLPPGDNKDFLDPWRKNCHTSADAVLLKKHKNTILHHSIVLLNLKYAVTLYEWKSSPSSCSHSFLTSFYVSIRSGDTEWYEGQAGGAGQGEREAASQEGAVQRTPAVSCYSLSGSLTHSRCGCWYGAHGSALLGSLI